ncbi:MAG TPA: ATP-binding protein [Candidatus Eisenbacteria bacterium]
MTTEIWPRFAEIIRRIVFLRPGLRLALILAVALFALVVGIGSALVEISTITRLEVRAAISRGELANSLIISQLGQAVINSPGRSLHDAIAYDERVGTTLEDARGFIPGLVEVTITDTANVVMRSTQPELAGRLALPREELEPADGLGLLRQGFSLLRVTEPFEVATGFEVDGRQVGTVRALISPGLMREELKQVFDTHLVKLGLQVLLATIFAFAVSWLVVLKPLGRIGDALGRLQRGEYSGLLEEDDPDDIGNISRQINELAARMAQQRQEFMHTRDEGDALRRLVNAVDDGLIMIDADRKILMANEQAIAHLGGDAEELVGRDLRQILPPESPLLSAVNAAFAGVPLESSPMEFMTPTGPRMLLATCQMADDATGRSVAMISLRDYGRIMRIREMIDHARVLSRIGQMAAGVAHEVRNPLNAMNIHLQLLKEKMPAGNGDGGRPHLVVVQDEIARLERVVSGFLKIARNQELSYKRIKVEPFLDKLVELVQPAARMAGIRVDLKVFPGVPDLYGDQEVLHQAFLNLVLNAIQASTAGSGPVTIAASPDANQVCITVSDHGRGMTEEVLEQAFKLYFSTRKEGSGVGLALVQQSVEMHGGRVEVESEPGKGTRFTICIPAVDAG